MMGFFLFPSVDSSDSVKGYLGKRDLHETRDNMLVVD